MLPVRLLLFGGAVLASLGIAWFISSCGNQGLPVISLADAVQELWKSETLDTNRAVLLQSMGRVDAIITELLEGRLSLVEAARQLQAERHNRPRSCRTDLSMYPGETEEERHLHLILTFAEVRLRNTPQSVEVLRRLQGELEDYRQIQADADRFD
jgi:hypothetical protein